MGRGPKAPAQAVVARKNRKVGLHGADQRAEEGWIAAARTEEAHAMGADQTVAVWHSAQKWAEGLPWEGEAAHRAPLAAGVG